MTEGRQPFTAEIKTLATPGGASSSRPPPFPTNVHSHKAREPKRVIRLSVHAASGKLWKMAAPPCGWASEEDPKTQSSVIEAMILSRWWVFHAPDEPVEHSLALGVAAILQLLDFDEG
jgi:hypothetical protein